jgi:hypothetical protein
MSVWVESTDGYISTKIYLLRENIPGRKYMSRNETKINEHGKAAGVLEHIYLTKDSRRSVGLPFLSEIYPNAEL